jgi:hypothetical protein
MRGYASLENRLRGFHEKWHLPFSFTSPEKANNPQIIFRLFILRFDPRPCRGLHD